MFKSYQLAQMVTVRISAVRCPLTWMSCKAGPAWAQKTANCVMCEAFKDPQGIAAVDTPTSSASPRLVSLTKALTAVLVLCFLAVAL